MRTSAPLLLTAIGAGVLLALMISTNSYLASYNSPLFAAWLAHGTGAIAAWLLLKIFLWRKKPAPASQTKAPWWSYLGGIPGALTVLLAAITVNSPLGLAGSLALMLAGQILFALFSDALGLFGVLKRRLSLRDLAALLLIFAGSAILIINR